MSTVRRFTGFMFGVVGLWLSLATESRADALKYVRDDVVAVTVVDVSRLKVNDFIKTALGESAEAELVRNELAAISQPIDHLAQAGVQRIYFLHRIADFLARGSSCVVEVAPGTSPAVCLAALQKFVEPMPAGAAIPRQFQVADQIILGAMNEEQLAYMRQHSDGPRADAQAALAFLHDADAGVVLLGDADSRRVLRETFPPLPPPFDRLNGPLVADDVRWAGLALQSASPTLLRLRVETSNAAVAETLRGLAAAGLKLVEQQLNAAPATRVVDQLRPSVEGVALQLTVGDRPETWPLLRQLVTPDILRARQAAQRAQRINDFKQLALAYLTYESDQGKLLEQANYDPNGKPLLSWRVHLLPYLDQEALYQQFHLQEPWDSAHNRGLINRMPAIFADPDPQLAATLGPGRTRWVAPVGKETVFPPRGTLENGAVLKLRDVTDGTSVTMLFVEATPERAVVWTQPEDWNVDLAQPLDGVKSADGEGFIGVRCDGSVQFYGNDTSAELVRSLLTRNAGDQ